MFQLFLKRRPMGRIRGSNPRVKINGLAGQGDPTRMKPGRTGQSKGGGSGRIGSGGFEIWWVGSGPIGSGRVSSGLSFAGRVGSCQKAFSFLRVGSVQVNIPLTVRGLGQVR